MAGFPQLKAVSIRQSVGEAIRRALLEGRFRPGEALSEVAIATEMNVSRGPVREALLVLSQEGLVSHSQNYGFSVMEFTEADLTEVSQVRLPLETLALKLAKPNVAGSHFRKLRDCKTRMVSAFQRRDFVECTQADLAFHSLIWECSGNSRLIASLRNLLVPYFAYGSAFRISRPDLTAELLEEQHESYIVYLEGGATLSAKECVRLHASV